MRRNECDAYTVEEIAMDDLEVKMAIDNTMKKDLNCAETSSPLFQEIWAMMDGDISFSGKRAITV